MYFGSRLALSKISPVRGIAGCAIAVIVLSLSTRILPLKVTFGILKGQNPGITVIGALMEKLYKPILEYAKKENLPVLDLPNTFNPFQKDLYLSEIEPSEKGGQLIAEQLAFIIRNIKNIPSQSIIYKPLTITAHEPEQWAVRYPSKLTLIQGEAK